MNDKCNLNVKYYMILKVVQKLGNLKIPNYSLQLTLHLTFVV